MKNKNIINENALATAITTLGSDGDYTVTVAEGTENVLIVRYKGEELCCISNDPSSIRISCNDMEQGELFELVRTVQRALKKPSYPISGSEPHSWRGILTDEQIAALTV